MLVVDHNTHSTYWGLGDTVNPMSYAGEVVVTFDPSKTNMAMVVGTPDGYILNTLEFSGNNRRRGPVMDTTVYCEEVRSFLKSYLSNVTIYMVGVEQAIQKEGNNHYRSSMVLTEIRGNLLNFFLEVFGVKVIEVNNWSWKFAILPEGYRSKYEKGSKKWFLNTMPDSPYSKYFEADMTDCICIYWYMISKMCSGYSCYCNQYEKCLFTYQYFFSPIGSDLGNVRELIYNPMFTLEENIGYYVNRVLTSFYMKIAVNKISLDYIYGHAVGFDIHDLGCDDVKVVARRTF